MKNIRYLVLATLLFGFASFSIAEDEQKPQEQVQPQQNFEVKTVGVVDLKRIIEEAVAAKDAEKEINQIKDKYLAEIKAQDQKLQQRQKELQEQRKAMSDEAFNKQINDFKNKIDAERKEALKKEKVVEAAFMKSLELIRDETSKIVTEIAQEKKLDMVVPKAQILYSKNGLDITQEVLDRLNKKLTKVNINIKNDSGAKPAAPAAKTDKK